MTRYPLLVTNDMMKLAPEGYPYIAFFAVITLIVFFAIGLWTALLPFLITLFMLFFFRDPERRIPGEENIFVSPADGKVILITLNPPTPPLLRGGSEEGLLKGGEERLSVGKGFIEVSVFMSPLDVHVNRSPCDGAVESVVHTRGRFLSAFKHEASVENEKIEMVLNTKHGKILVRQVAGFLARRAVCRVKPSDALKRGERYGVIKFSSRLDLYLPKETKIRVKLGDKVKAGETVIGETHS